MKKQYRIVESLPPTCKKSKRPIHKVLDAVFPNRRTAKNWVRNHGAIRKLEIYEEIVL